MYSLGFDIGGTKCAAVLGGEKFESADNFVIDKISFPTDVKRGWRKIVDELLSSADELAKRNSIDIGKDVFAIGVSCGGPLDSRKGTINCPPNLPDWNGVPIVKMIEDRYGVKTVLQNDANACAVAEWKFGAGRGCGNMIFLTFGTGLGAGLILNGRLYTGANDMAGEVGHIRLTPDGPLGYGKNGSFEGYCSGGGIADLAKRMAKTTSYTSSPAIGDIDNVSAKSLAVLARDGDDFALSVYEKCGEMLGHGLSILIDIINPERIVIGSIYQRSGDLLNKKMTEVISREALEISSCVCEIVPAALGDSIGDLASLGLCFG